MSELETTSLQLQTNSIFNILRNILDFYMETDFEEDVVDIGNYVIAIFKDWEHDCGVKMYPGIEIFDSVENKRRVKLSVEEYGSDHEWISASAAVWTGVKLKEISINGPAGTIKEIFIDQTIKKIIPEDFYKFLVNLNIDMVKMNLI